VDRHQAHRVRRLVGERRVALVLSAGTRFERIDRLLEREATVSRERGTVPGKLFQVRDALGAVEAERRERQES